MGVYIVKETSEATSVLHDMTLRVAAGLLGYFRSTMELPRIGNVLEWIST